MCPSAPAFRGPRRCHLLHFNGFGREWGGVCCSLSLALATLLVATAEPGLGADRRHFGNQCQRQPPHSRRDHQGSHLHQAGGCLRRGRAGARLQFSVEHRLLRRHQVPAGADAQGLAPHLPGEGKADDPRNQLRRAAVRFPTATSSTASSRTKSGWWWRASTIPRASRRRKFPSKDLLSEHGRQFATIRTEVRQIPPAAVGITFVVKEGPKVKVGKIKFEGNKAHQVANSARGHEEPEADRHSPFHLPGKYFRQDLRRHQAGRRHRAGARRVPEPRLLQGER